MDIQSRLDFAADPKTVYLMMTDKQWLEQLVSRSGATSHTIEVAGNTTRVQMGLEVPPAMRAFAGSTMNSTQTVVWDEAAADGSRQATLSVQLAGLPAAMHGRARLHPGGRGTIVDYTGTLEVKVPLVGRKMEQAAAPYLKEAMDAQQQVGDEWLASHT